MFVDPLSMGLSFPTSALAACIFGSYLEHGMFCGLRFTRMLCRFAVSELMCSDVDGSYCHMKNEKQQ